MSYYDPNSIDDRNSAIQKAFNRQAESSIKSLVFKVIRKAQTYSGEFRLLASDDGPLRNVWEEYCAQLQDEYWFGFDLEQQLIESICIEELEKLGTKNPILYGVMAVYLSDLFAEQADLEFGMYAPKHLGAILRERFIDEAASDYQNYRIQKFLGY